MNPLFSEAFFLLGVGMITIFSILALIVLSGKVLIRLVNRFAPLPVTSPLVSALRSAKEEDARLSQQQLAAIAASVEVITQGKGTIIDIEPLP